jgi:hypothetical protein
MASSVSGRFAPDGVARASDDVVAADVRWSSPRPMTKLRFNQEFGGACFVGGTTGTPVTTRFA